MKYYADCAPQYPECRTRGDEAQYSGHMLARQLEEEGVLEAVHRSVLAVTTGGGPGYHSVCVCVCVVCRLHSCGLKEGISSVGTQGCELVP